MPVDSQHSEYQRLSGIWKECRDIIAGQKAVHDAKTRYLPKLEGESDKDYDARRCRATFFNATRRTVTALRGLVFRKPPTVTVPKALEPLLEDVTMGGVPLNTFVRDLLTERLKVGRVGVIVDYPSVSTEGMTAAQAQRLNLRPKMAMYKAETIINWAHTWVSNRIQLSLVVLAETAEIKTDEFSAKMEQRWRVLDLTEGIYRVRVFRKDPERPDQFQLVEPEYYPKMDGAPMSYIPFFFVGEDTVCQELNEPPLLDLVNINLSHYRSTADRKHGAHKTALPQPYVCGWSPATSDTGQPIEHLTIGGSDAWAFPNPETSVGMLEYQGQGLATLKEELEREEQQMAVLGARMLEQQKRAVEAAETAVIHRTGENATLADEAQAVSRSVTKMLEVFAKWAGIDPSGISYELNRDFLPLPMDPAMLEKLVASWQQGALSKEELFYNLKQGEVIRDGTTYEQHEADISNAPPAMALALGSNQPPS